MTQIIPQWVEIEEFSSFASKLVEKYVERFGHIDVSKIIAYACVNKDRPERSNESYKISGAAPPESFTNTKNYFVKMYHNIWDQTRAQKLAVVYSILKRIDKDRPGKVIPLDYSDQEEMVSTFGPNWHQRSDLPDILEKDIESLNGRIL